MDRADKNRLMQAIQDVQNGYSNREAGRRNAVSETTIRRWLKNNPQNRTNSTLSAEEREAIDLKRRMATLERENKRLREAEVDRQKIYQFFNGLTEQEPDPPQWVVDSGAGGSEPGTPTITFSDWHLGEEITRAETNGVNVFNTEIARQRVYNLVTRTIDLCFEHMTNARYPGIVAAVLGDMVNGELRSEDSIENEQHLMPQILLARDLLAWAIEQLADAFGRVFVPCVSGNHGRHTVRPHARGYVYKNYDYLVYCLLKRYFHPTDAVTGEPKGTWDNRVVFQIPVSNEALYSVYGVRYLAQHGDDLGVKGGDGIIGALGPIMRGEIKTRQMQTAIERDFDILVMGHYHQTLWLPRVHVTNCLCGFNEFSRQKLKAVPEMPSQSLWMTHPKWGRTFQSRIFCDDAPQVSDQQWCAFEEAA